MKEKIKTQKGFIQIPLLLIIITLAVVASAGTGYVLHKKGKLAPLEASISNLIGNNKSENSKIEEAKIEDIQQVESTSQSSYQKQASPSPIEPSFDLPKSSSLPTQQTDVQPNKQSEIITSPSINQEKQVIPETINSPTPPINNINSQEKSDNSQQEDNKKDIYDQLAEFEQKILRKKIAKQEAELARQNAINDLTVEYNIKINKINQQIYALKKQYADDVQKAYAQSGITKAILNRQIDNLTLKLNLNIAPLNLEIERLQNEYQEKLNQI